MQAPDRIWVQDGAGYEGEDILIAHDGSEIWHKCFAIEYHIARPGQPCSTDEFLRLLRDWIGKDVYMRNKFYHRRVGYWLSGDFNSAMDGLK